MNIFSKMIIALTFGAISAVPASAQAMDIEGASLGGKVRNGPGTDSQQIGSLKESALVVIQENTGIMLNGYPWFKIIHIDNQTGYSIAGYQWGGILCAFERGVSGVFNTCPRFWSDNEEWLRKTENQNNEASEQPIAPRHSDDDNNSGNQVASLAGNGTAEAIIAQCLADENATGGDGSACINRFADPCNEKNESYSRGDPTCSSKEFEVWDRILNAEYKRLRNLLFDKEKQDRLREAQRKWNQFADSFCPLSYAFTLGSMHRVTSVDCKIRITAQQAFELYRLSAIHSEPQTCAITHCR